MPSPDVPAAVVDDDKRKQSCEIDGCTKHRAWKCDTYCRRHYREFVGTPPPLGPRKGPPKKQPPGLDLGASVEEKKGGKEGEGAGKDEPSPAKSSSDKSSPAGPKSKEGDGKDGERRVEGAGVTIWPSPPKTNAPPSAAENGTAAKNEMVVGAAAST